MRGSSGRWLVPMKHTKLVGVAHADGMNFHPPPLPALAEVTQPNKEVTIMPPRPTSDLWFPMSMLRGFMHDAYMWRIYSC